MLYGRQTIKRAHSARWLVLITLLVLPLGLNACDNGQPPASASAPVHPPSLPTSTPSIVFIKEEPLETASAVKPSGDTEETREVRVRMLSDKTGILVLDNGCLRVKDLDSDRSSLIIWEHEYSLNIENDEIQILDGDGEVAARVGEEVYMGGGPRGSDADLGDYIQGQIPHDCPGPYWMAGSIRTNIFPDSELAYVDLINTADSEFFFLRKKDVLDDWAATEDDYLLYGELIQYGSRCLAVSKAYDPMNPKPATYIPSGISFIPLWPPDYQARSQNGKIEILDGAGQIAARVGEKVRLSGGRIPQAGVEWTIGGEVHQLQSKLPCECACYGPYWIVGDVR